MAGGTFLLNSLKLLKKRGVKIKIAANITNEVRSQIEELAGLVELRQANTPARFCVVDGKEALLMPLDDEIANPASDVGIWVRSKFFASTFEKLFEAAWPGLKTVF